MTDLFMVKSNSLSKLAHNKSDFPCLSSFGTESRIFFTNKS